MSPAPPACIFALAIEPGLQLLDRGAGQHQSLVIEDVVDVRAHRRQEVDLAHRRGARAGSRTPNEGGPNGGYYQVGNLSNDVFFPYTSGVVDYHLQIFNRWGELIFESRDVNIGWDGYYRGKLSQLGVYVWKAEVKLINDRVFKQSGNLTLIR